MFVSNMAGLHLGEANQHAAERNRRTSNERHKALARQPRGKNYNEYLRPLGRPDLPERHNGRAAVRTAEEAASGAVLLATHAYHHIAAHARWRPFQSADITYL
jgi:hypothetical protein